MAAQVLGGLDYQVIVAGSPQEALERSRSWPGLIDLLLSDVVMPEQSGPDLAAVLLQTRPGLRVLYMSGYTDGTTLEHGVVQPGVTLIAKPFSVSSLATQVRAALDAALVRDSSAG